MIFGTLKHKNTYNTVYNIGSAVTRPVGKKLPSYYELNGVTLPLFSCSAPLWLMSYGRRAQPLQQTETTFIHSSAHLCDLGKFLYLPVPIFLRL